jgi:hypothetical protein
MKYSVEHALSTIRNMWPLLLATILHVQMFEFVCLRFLCCRFGLAALLSHLRLVPDEPSLTPPPHRITEGRN